MEQEVKMSEMDRKVQLLEEEDWIAGNLKKLLGAKLGSLNQ